MSATNRSSTMVDMPASAPDDVPRSTASGPAPPEDRYRILVALIFGLFMVVLDSTVVNVAFPVLHQDLGASISVAQWVLSIYVLTLGVTTPLSGLLGDRFGAKRIYLLGLVAFAVGSLGSGLAPSVGWMIGARALQGVGGGMSLSLATATLFRTFPKNEQGKALGIFGVAIVLAPAVGPILGGALVSAGYWRWIFFINLPIAAVGVILGSRWLHESRSDEPEPVRLLNVMLSTVGFAAALYAASIASQDGWTSPLVLLTGVGGIAVLVVFVLVELRSAHPILRVQLFTGRSFALGNLITYAAALGIFGGSFLLPIYLQTLRGVSAFETGLLLLPQAVVAGVATPLAGRLFDKIGARPLLVVGTIVLTIDNLALAAIGPDESYATLCWWLALRGLSLALIIQPARTAALGSVPARLSARATATSSAGRYLAQAFSVAILSTIVAGSVSSDVRSLQAQYDQGGASQQSELAGGLCDASLRADVGSAVASTGSPAHQLPAHTSGVLREACKEQVDGIDAAFRLTLGASGIAVVMALFMPGWPGRREEETDDEAATAPGSVGSTADR